MAYLTPEDYAALLRQGQAQQIGGQRAAGQPMSHWTQALASALNQGFGAARQDFARTGRTDATTAGNEMLAAGMGGDQAALAEALKNPFVADQARQWQAQAPARARAADAAQRAQWAFEQEKQNAPLKRQQLELANQYRQAQINAQNRPAVPKLQKIGVDAYNRPQYGFVGPDGSVRPYEMPAPQGASPAPTAGGIPPGLDPELTEILKAAPPRKRALFNQMWKAGKPDKAIAMLEEKPLAGEAAARVGLLRQAGKVVPRLRQLWIEDAKERGSVAEGANYVLGRGDVGEARRLSSGAMEGILRAATGAAVTASEEARYSRMFVPDPTDTIETRDRKLNALQRFISDIELALNQGRQLSQMELDDLSAKAAKGISVRFPGMEGEQPGVVTDDVKKRADEILRKRGISQ